MHVSFAGARSQKNRKNINQTNLHLEPNDYRIYYVNIDLSQSVWKTFLMAKRPFRRGARRNGCI